MEKEWKANTNYYLEYPIQILDTPIDLGDLASFGYPETLEEIPEKILDHYGIVDNITLGIILMTKKFTANNTVAFNVQVIPYGNWSQYSSATKFMLNSDDFEMAKAMYGVDGFMSEEEYKKLIIKE